MEINPENWFDFKNAFKIDNCIDLFNKLSKASSFEKYEYKVLARNVESY